MSRKEAGSYCVTELGQTRIIFPRKGQNFQLENSLVLPCGDCSAKQIYWCWVVTHLVIMSTLVWVEERDPHQWHHKSDILKLTPVIISLTGLAPRILIKLIPEVLGGSADQWE